MPGSAERKPIDLGAYREKRKETQELKLAPLREKFDELHFEFFGNVNLWKRSLQKSLGDYNAGIASADYNQFEYYRYRNEHDKGNFDPVGDDINARILNAERDWKEYLAFFQESREQYLPELQNLKAQYSRLQPPPPEMQTLRQYVDALMALRGLDKYSSPSADALEVVQQFQDLLGGQPAQREEMAG